MTVTFLVLYLLCVNSWLGLLAFSFIHSLRSNISGKENHMNKDVGVRFADFISIFFNIP